jgi:hypothetical protein
MKRFPIDAPGPPVTVEKILFGPPLSNNIQFAFHMSLRTSRTFGKFREKVLRTGYFVMSASCDQKYSRKVSQSRIHSLLIATPGVVIVEVDTVPLNSKTRYREKRDR